MKKKKRKSKEKQTEISVMEKEPEIDFKTEEVSEEETENQNPNLEEAILQLVQCIDLSDRKHIVAAERMSNIEKSIAGITFFMDIILAIPEIRNNLPEHVQEALDKRNKKTEAPEAEKMIEESETEIIPLKDRIKLLETEAEKVTKKMRI